MENLRYKNAIKRYEELFGKEDVEIYSAPGRTEVCGNHTDHQNGMVLAASVNLDAIAVAGRQNGPMIKIFSEGYGMLEIDIRDLSYHEKEKGTTLSLVKGVVKKIEDQGYHIGGFKAYVTSNVLGGSGLSSSAAFETLIGTIISGLFNEMSISAIEIACIGQYAENQYFGKPSGLMDQMACSVGGFVHIDFKDKEHPIVNKVPFDIASHGYSLCIVDTKGSHAHLTDDYAKIPIEMKEVASFFGKEYLADIDRDVFFEEVPKLYNKVGNRSLLRAIHFFTENERVKKAADALRGNQWEEFLRIIKESGDSSFKYLQNVYSSRFEDIQPISVALACSENILGNHGVCRVHGGGFAGTIQIFVESEYVPVYKKRIEEIFGQGTCYVLQIRKNGGIRVNL